MSVGMPRPLSVTLIELSGWMVTDISLQYPANASSTALSTASNTIWCRPLPSLVSPIYMPGRFLTASKPLSTLMFVELYSLIIFFHLFHVKHQFHVRSMNVRLNTHRHDYIFKFFIAWHCYQNTAIGIAKRKGDRLRRGVVQPVQQVIYIESYIQRCAMIVCFHIF